MVADARQIKEDQPVNLKHLRAFLFGQLVQVRIVGGVNRRAAEIVVLSLSGEGALLVTGEGAWRARPPPAQVVSTIGAGDSFVGAMVWAIGAGRDITDAFRYGVAAGTAALLSPGTKLSRREDVLRLFHDVRLEPA